MLCLTLNALLQNMVETNFIIWEDNFAKINNKYNYIIRTAPVDHFS